MIVFVLTVVATAYLFAALVVVGAKSPAYSHMRHTISELGEFGSPRQNFVAFGIFLPVGVLLLAVAFLLHSVNQPAALLALCIGIGYVVAALFPCDPGSPASGSSRQALHNLGGAVEYLGGAFALLRLAESFGLPFRAAGFVVFGAAVALSVTTFAPIRGLVQRIAEICLFGGLAFSLWRIGAVV
jgi:Protein of unknown function (DUF998)